VSAIRLARAGSVLAEEHSRARTMTILAATVVLAAACITVARQPVTAPWWLYADCDATYTGAAEVLALAFGVESLAHGGPQNGFAFSEMLHLNRTRPIVRGFAITFFIGGAVLAFLLVGRLLGGWPFGLAAGLLWLAQPELRDTIEIRPDVLQAALALVIGFLLTRALERRSAALMAAAAAMLGFAMTAKLAIFALFLPLALVSVVAHPDRGWPARTRTDLRRFASRHRVGLAIAVVLWLGMSIVSNRHAPAIMPLSPTEREQFEVAAFVALDYGIGCFAVRRWSRSRLLRRLFDPLYLLLVFAFVVGVASTVCLLLADGFNAIESVIQTLGGGNVNARIHPYAGLTLSYFETYPLEGPTTVFLVAGVAAVAGLVRRSFWPLLWFSGAAVAALSAAARAPLTSRYDALPYILAIPPALWLCSRLWRSVGVPLAIGLVAVAVVPTFQHSRDDAEYAARQERAANATERLGDRFLRPGQVAIVPASAPSPDADWWSYVAGAGVIPSYPYRYLPDDPAHGFVFSLTQQSGLRIRYYIGPEALAITHEEPLRLSLGTYEARPLPGGRDPADAIAAVELVSILRPRALPTCSCVA
jgi:hypothetical protein